LPYADTECVGTESGASPYELVPERCRSCNRVFNGEGELDTHCAACRRRLDLEPR